MSRIQVTCSGRGAPGTEPRGVARTAGDAAGWGALRHSAASPGCRPPLVPRGDSRAPPPSVAGVWVGAGPSGVLGPSLESQRTVWRRFFAFHSLPAFPVSPVRKRALLGAPPPSPARPPQTHTCWLPSEPRAWASARLELSNAALFSLFIFPFFWNLTQTFLLRCGCRAHF